MGTFFVTKKMWELEGRKIARLEARREVSKARIFLYGLGDGTASWKEKILGRRNFASSHYREGGKKLLMG